MKNRKIRSKKVVHFTPDWIVHFTPKYSHEHIEHPKFFAPTAKVFDIYLKDDEINTIYNHDFSNN